MANLLTRLFSRKPKNEPDNKPLNLYQYKFIRYKENREKLYPMTSKNIHVPQTKGLVSVILPVYNGGEELRESIESVLKQTYTHFEFIIVNDGSTDLTADIISEYEKKDARIIAIHQENRKLPRTLSRGFENASGEFYTWTSADNIMPENFLEKMVAELEKDENVDMVYGNMRLIDKNGKWYRRHGWYEFPINSGNVILPSSTYELNTYANNTIGAAFMYRARCAKVLGEYSQYKHTLEDYDYWMRLNSLFTIKHTSFAEPIYYYRWHENSLTAKDEELGITKNRYKLMMLDDFRRDFYLSPLVWYIEAKSENQQLAEEMKASLVERGQILVDKADFEKLNFGKAAHTFVYVNIGEAECSINLPNGTKKVYIADKTEVVPEDYDIYISREGFGKSEEAVLNLPMLDEHRGWFAFSDMDTMLSFIDAKAKNEMLYDIEGIIESDKKFTKKLSVVICTNKASKTLKECLNSVCEQTINKSLYEIIFVNNDFMNDEIKEIAEEVKATHKTVNINYITAPRKGLSYARNAGLWEAEGMLILYLDDDAIAEPELVEKTIGGFRTNESFGVLGGQVLLEVPPGNALGNIPYEMRALWSEYEISSAKVRQAKNYGEFPYGANFGARTQALMQIGGFRCGYGRVGNNYGGGEETLVSFMMKDINMTVGLNPKSYVMHKVDPARFNFEHIEKTTKAGILTQYRLRMDLYAPFDWSVSNIDDKIKEIRTNLKSMKEGTVEYVHCKAEAEAYEEVKKLCDEDIMFMKTRGDGKY